MDRIEEALNHRAYELGYAALTQNRNVYTAQCTNTYHVPLAYLPLDDDALFHQMEVERAKLQLTDASTHQGRLTELDERLCNRLNELASEYVAQELASLTQTPRGVPITILEPYKDSLFVALLTERRGAAHSSHFPQTTVTGSEKNKPKSPLPPLQPISSSSSFSSSSKPT